MLLPYDKSTRQVAVRSVALVVCIGVAALLSEAADWRPWWLVAALAGVMVLADIVAIQTRHVRVSAGLMVQTTSMALLGAAPALGIGVSAAAAESRHNRVRLTLATSNMLIVAVLALVGGVLFEQLGDHYGSTGTTRATRCSSCPSTRC